MPARSFQRVFWLANVYWLAQEVVTSQKDKSPHNWPKAKCEMVGNGPFTLIVHVNYGQDGAGHETSHRPLAKLKEHKV